MPLYGAIPATCRYVYAEIPISILTISVIEPLNNRHRPVIVTPRDGRWRHGCDCRLLASKVVFSDHGRFLLQQPTTMLAQLLRRMTHFDSIFSTNVGGCPMILRVSDTALRLPDVCSGCFAKSMVFAQRCVAPLDTASAIPASESSKHQSVSLCGSGEGIGVITSMLQ
jgi:hypothetical protein